MAVGSIGSSVVLAVPQAPTLPGMCRKSVYIFVMLNSASDALSCTLKHKVRYSLFDAGRNLTCRCWSLEIRHKADVRATARALCVCACERVRYGLC